MKPLLAIAWLTWKAAFRFRLFWVLTLLLLGCVLLFPLLLKDDGTARGFIQILLTYNLSVISALLGFSTLWLSCGTLARDIEECQIQVVAVKPIARWQIWFGKWLGIMLLNGALLGLSGATVFTLLKVRAQNLPETQQQILQDEIFTARAAIREPMPNLEEPTERIFRERLEQTPVPADQHEYVKTQIREQLKAGMQVVPPNHFRRWTLDLGMQRHLIEDQPLFMRIKFYAAQTNASGTYLGLWEIGPPDSAQAQSYPMSLAAETFHEFQLPPNLYDANGVLTVEFVNQNQTALLFPLEEGFEILYREGGFGLNFLRGLLVILSWLGLMAALGLASASFLSFPVAAFFSLSLLVVGLSSGTLANVVEEDTVLGRDHETGAGGAQMLDTMLIPVFKGILSVVDVVQSTSPVEALSTGRSITWGQLLAAWGEVVFLFGGLLALLGIWLFYRRELALPQGT